MALNAGVRWGLVVFYCPALPSVGVEEGVLEKVEYKDAMENHIEHPTFKILLYIFLVRYKRVFHFVFLVFFCAGSHIYKVTLNIIS